MKLYSENKEYKLYEGSMLDMLEVIEPNSIDSIITDPPYGLTSITKRFGKENSAEAKYGKDGSFQRLSKGFMGKEWDGSGIEYNIDAWQKCYEVLKPGGYLLAFGGSRTFHRIACAIEDAGFEIRDTIMWIYGSGFPKSLDISKQIDKKGGNDYSKQFAKDLKEAREKRNLTMKYCDDKYCGGSTNWSWYEGRPNGVRVPDYATYLKIIEEFPELEKYKDLIKEAEREVIGTTITNKTVYQNIGGDNIAGEVDITIPKTELAKKWKGWGSALKPAYEPIIVARKPVENSIVDNVLKYGVGGINIDECRISTNDDLARCNGTDKGMFGVGNNNKNKAQQCKEQGLEYGGRFPSNVILTYDETDFEEVCGGMPIGKKNGSISKEYKINNQVYGEYGNCHTWEAYDDEGSASRYFYCAKASKFDRDEGLEELQAKQLYNGDGRYNSFEYFVKKDEEGNIINAERKNIHPTVKPTNLMRYLVRLVSPKGATILDCFNGSGSTGKAVMLENKEFKKDYKYIGIELTEEYLPITKARIEYICNNDFDFTESSNNVSEHKVVEKGYKKTNIFDFIGSDD